MIEYVLNFMGATGKRKFNQWKPVGATPDDCTTVKKSAEGLLDYLVRNINYYALKWY